MPNTLEVKNLTKTYHNFKAVDGISFEIATGEIFSLIGPNGAGKSTTLKMLSTILIPTSGTAFINGMDIQKDADKVRTQICYLPEEAGAYKNLTGMDYLNFMADLYAENNSQKKEFVDFARNITELKDRLKDKVKTYSKGMTRKLLLARAVMTRPKLAILDEPTSGLDIVNAMEIRGIIKKLAKEGMTVLLSSHNMLEIEFLSDRVGFIHKGKLLDIGAPTALKSMHQAVNLEEVFMKITSV